MPKISDLTVAPNVVGTDTIPGQRGAAATYQYSYNQIGPTVAAAAVLTGASDPTTATVGYVGQIYINTTTDNYFICTDTTAGVYTWSVSSYTEMTPYIVGLSSADAPYTSIQDAIDAAAAVATDTDRKTVYIQPGTYTEDISLKTNVKVFALPVGFNSITNADTHVVFLNGTVTVDSTAAAINASLSGISINGGATNPAISVTGANSIELGLSYLYLTCDDNAALSCDSGAAVLTFTATSIFGPNANAPLNIQDCAGVFMDVASSINSASNSPSYISSTTGGTQFFYLGAYCFAPFQFGGVIQAILLGQIGFANSDPFVYLASATASVNLQMQAVNVFSGTYAIDGVAGASVTVGGTAFPIVSLINPILTRANFNYMFGPISYDFGESFLTIDTDSANRTLTISGDSAIDQDVTTTGTPVFDSATVNELILNTNTSGNLVLSSTESLSADRNLTFVVNNADFQFFLTDVATLDNCVIQKLTSLNSAIQTTNATPTQIIGVNVNENESVTLTGAIVGTKSDYSDGISGTFSVGARRETAGSAVIIGGLTDAGFIGQSDNVSLSVDSTITGNALVITVTGIAATTYNWQAQYTIVTN